jgi:hypothetical protein
MSQNFLNSDVVRVVETIREKVGPEEAQTAEKICAYGINHGFTVRVNGYGKIEGRFPLDGKLMKRFGISASGNSHKYYVYFHTENLNSIALFNKESSRLELFNRLREIHPAMRITTKAEAGNGSPSILLSDLKDSSTLTKWFQTLGWFIESIKNQK